MDYELNECKTRINFLKNILENHNFPNGKIDVLLHVGQTFETKEQIIEELKILEEKFKSLSEKKKS